MTEQYYIWQRNALLGGTVTDGPPAPVLPRRRPRQADPRPFRLLRRRQLHLVRPRRQGHCIVFRSDCLADFQGQRTGIPAPTSSTRSATSVTYAWAILRPEVRFDYTSGQKGYDNGTKRDQFTFSTDLIIRF